MTPDPPAPPPKPTATWDEVPDLTVADLEAIKAAAIRHYEETQPEYGEALAESLRRSAIFYKDPDDYGRSRIGVWVFEHHIDELHLVHHLPPPMAPFFGVILDRVDGKWVVNSEYIGEEFWEEMP